MNKENTIISGSVAAFGAVISHFSDMLTPLFFMLIAFEIMDYVSGMVAAWSQEGWSSKEALQGVLKKLGYFLLVAVGFGLDYLVWDFKTTTGLDFEIPSMFGVMTMWFLLSTELISIVENMSQIGVNIPFIAPALKLFRDKVGKITDKRKDDEQ